MKLLHPIVAFFLLHQLYLESSYKDVYTVLAQEWGLDAKALQLPTEVRA